MVRYLLYEHKYNCTLFVTVQVQCFTEQFRKRKKEKKRKQQESVHVLVNLSRLSATVTSVMAYRRPGRGIRIPLFLLQWHAEQMQIIKKPRKRNPDTQAKWRLTHDLDFGRLFATVRMLFCSCNPLDRCLSCAKSGFTGPLTVNIEFQKRIARYLSFLSLFFCLNWKHSDPCVKRERVKFHEKKFCLSWSYE